MPISNDDSLTSAQAGASLGVSTQTIQKWVDAGALKAWRTVGGHRRVRVESVNRMLQLRGHLLPAHSATGAPQAAQPVTTAAVLQPSLMLVEDDVDAAAMVRNLRAHPGASNLRVVMVTHHSPQELHEFGAVPTGVPVLRKPARLQDLRQALGLPAATA